MMMAAGFSASYCLIKDSKERCAAAASLFKSSSILEDAIKYTRATVSEALRGSPVDFESFENSADPEVSRLFKLICSSEYEAAQKYAAALKNYTEKEMQKVTEKEERTRGAMAYLPPAAAALAAILLI